MELQHLDLHARPTPAGVDLDVVELEAAIELVAAGIATRVRVVGLRDGAAVAPYALAAAQRAGVAFRLDPVAQGGRRVATVGPAIEPVRQPRRQ